MTPLQLRKSLALTIQKKYNRYICVDHNLHIYVYDIPYLYISWQSRKSEA